MNMVTAAGPRDTPMSTDDTEILGKMAFDKTCSIDAIAFENQSTW